MHILGIMELGKLWTTPTPDCYTNSGYNSERNLPAVPTPYPASKKKKKNGTAPAKNGPDLKLVRNPAPKPSQFFYGSVADSRSGGVYRPRLKLRHE